MKIQPLPMYSDYLQELKEIFDFQYDSQYVEQNFLKHIQVIASPDVLRVMTSYLKEDPDWQKKPQIKSFIEELIANKPEEI